ncbi:MAG: MarR family transcriptional regulator [Gammaproteobacteria bacterium]|jgi:DNA-binding MarR family transcriptional regulator|nr:MarR family transcriptional regulator [Gammaproteobacteria bacterium]
MRKRRADQPVDSENTPDCSHPKVAEEIVLMGDILEAMSRIFGGDATLNQLRIGNYVGIRSELQGCETSNSEIAEALDIPRSTVSRIITNFIEAGMLVEETNQADGRRRILRIAASHPHKNEFEENLRSILARFAHKRGSTPGPS